MGDSLINYVPPTPAITVIATSNLPEINTSTNNNITRSVQTNATGQYLINNVAVNNSQNNNATVSLYFPAMKFVVTYYTKIKIALTNGTTQYQWTSYTKTVEVNPPAFSVSSSFAIMNGNIFIKDYQYSCPVN